MDTLDSLDLGVSIKKAHRVRSWYLYEQYKSLERNQLDAVEKLKNRSYQDKILRQELSERKARRKLYSQHEIWPKASRIDHSVKSEGISSTHTLSSNDYYDSLCELHKNEYVNQDSNPEESLAYTQDDSFVDKLYEVDEFQSIDETKSLTSVVQSCNSAVCVKSDETLIDDFKEDFSFRNDKIEQLQHNLDKLTDDLERLEKCTIIYDDNEDVDECFCSNNLEPIVNINNDAKKCARNTVGQKDNNIFIMWTKLVSFASQIIQLNNGNCYHDYGSQILTAVLACDVIRIGINKMCHILQPYVCPIMFCIDEDLFIDHKSVKRKTPRKTCKREQQSYLKKIVQTSKESARKFHSEKCWQQYAPKTFTKNRNRRTSEPVGRIQKKSSNIIRENSCIKTCCSSWPFTEHSCENLCELNCDRVLNPMLKLAEYLDTLSREFDDLKFI